MARELATLSQGELGEAVGITGPAVSQFERGSAVPRAKVLSAFATKLDMPIQFFTAAELGADIPAYFRSLRGAPAGERKRARNYVQLIHELVHFLEGKVRLPQYDLPHHRFGSSEDSGSPADAARDVRSAWRIPEGPIENVVRIAERHGVIVARLTGGHQQIDAFSVPFTDRPVVVMSLAKGKRDRSRFDVAHELGHLVMHPIGAPTTKDIENQADEFAAELLMPADDIKHELPDALDWERFFLLKRKWQVSIAALLHRANDVGSMSRATYVQGMKTISSRGWRRDEPIDLGEPESPILLKSAIDKAGLTDETLAQQTYMPLRLLREVLEWAADDRPVVTL